MPDEAVKAFKTWLAEDGAEDPLTAYHAGWLAASRSIPAAVALLRADGWRVEEPMCETCAGRKYVCTPLETDCPTCNGTGRAALASSARNEKPADDIRNS